MKKSICLLGCAMMLMATACSKGEKQSPDQPVFNEAGMRRTVLYYETEENLLVPVVKSIPWEEGIGRAALRNLRATNEIKKSASELGLEAIFGDKTDFSLKIVDNVGVVDAKKMGKFESAAEEKNAISAIVNTLLNFPAMQSVKIKVDGKENVKLPHGTDLSQNFQMQDLNVEASGMMGESVENKIVLYFPSSNNALNVPVTRFLYDEPTLELAVIELLKGPSNVDALKCGIPYGTELLELKTNKGCAEINFSSEFEEIREYPQLEERVFETINLTLKQFEGIDSVKIKVEGKAYESFEPTFAPAFANEIR